MALLLPVLAGYGVHLVVTGVWFGWPGLGPGPRVAARARSRVGFEERLASAGLVGVRPLAVIGLGASAAGMGAAAMWLVFGGTLPALAGSVAGAAVPLLALRARRERQLAAAREHWPRLIDETRLKATSLGRSVPQALFEAAAGAPRELRPAFEQARREWLLSTDFERTLEVLARGLADPTADVVCETLLVAQQVGGSEVDRVLSALAQDRKDDLEGRRDARARQAGARFARSFTLAVPLGMALVGLSIGNGRSAYGTPMGQLLVVVGIAVMGACWLWAGRIMRLPEGDRVFDSRTG